MTIEIVKDNKIQVPLYHGTSTLFADAIAKEGLGGQLPIHKYPLIDLGTEIYKLSEKYLKHTALWGRSSFSFKAMIEQRNNAMDFSHNRLFLTGSLRKARNYASNKYGSEFVSYIASFYERLQDHRVEQKLLGEVLDFEIDKKKEFHFIREFVKTRYCPVVIKIKSLPLELVDMDQDRLKSILDSLNTAYNDEESDLREVFKETVTLKVKGAIPAENLEFYLVGSLKRDSNDIHGLKYSPLSDQVPLHSL